MHDMMHPSAASTSSRSDFVDCSNLRSFRWRVQLGLLPTPAPSTATTTDSNITSKWPAVLAQQREDYQRLVEQHPFPDDDEQLHKHGNINDHGVGDATDAITDTAATSSAVLLDPLTAMLMVEQEKSERLQELDLKYRREKALRKRGLAGNGDRIFEDEEYDEQAAALQIIDKDLDRLPSPRTKRQHAPESSPLSLSLPSPLSSKEDHDNINIDIDDNMVDVVLDDDSDGENYCQQRRVVLRQVLFVYTCENPDPGYRQGMHEIASYLLHALQLDQEAGSGNTDISTWSATDLAADTYTMLVPILQAILPAYDAKTPQQSQPLPAMSRRILSIISDHCPALHYTLTELHTPPQLYLTKWIRLLYSREVTHVLELWDVLFFPSVAVVVNANSTGNQNQYQHSWMTVLECTAAARLLLWRQQILQSLDASSRLNLLMNLPVEADTAPLEQLTKQLLDPQLRSAVILPEMLNAVAAAPVDTQGLPPTTTSSSAGPQHTLQEHSVSSPTDQGYQPHSSYEGDYGAAASALANRFSMSAVKQSLEQAKTQTESIKKRLYQEWGSLAVATSNSDHQYNNTQQQQQQNTNYSNNTYNASASSRKANVAAAGDPLRRNYDDPLMGGIDWSGGGGQSRTLSSASAPAAAASSSTAALIHPVQLNGERRQPHASNELPYLVHPHQSQVWAKSIQTSSTVLQDFVMAMEKQSAQQHDGNAKVVPAAVWEALADLELVRRDMLSTSSSSSSGGPVPSPPNT